MRDISSNAFRPKRMSYAVSVALASLMAGNVSMAQEARPAPAPVPKIEGEVTQVLVVATRKSAQSSIDRKKNARTAIDSIVAEDVGALPDRNVGEAISRMAGVALDRGDFGEGISVAVRGNSADLTRVEIDGQGVQAGGGTDLNGGGSGRGVELREMPADLIKSVDVVKGSTADMTEGSLGGGIIIKTRTGLDFKKRFMSLRVAGSQGSLNEKWSPDTNLIFADKFLDGRVGVLINGSTSRMNNESHSSQVATSGNQGYARAIDFDNSPQKTFAFNPSTVSASDPAATRTTLASPLSGGGFFNAATPLELVTRSANAATKADCNAQFPQLSAAQLNAMTTAAVRNAATVQRGNELITCLNQWNDYTPSLLRYFVKKQEDKRQNLDLRLDFKVNNELSVYAKGSKTRRTVDDNLLTYGLGGMNVNTIANSPTYFGPTFTDSAAGVRSAIPGSGYYLYNTPSFRTNLFPAQGAVANVVPGSVEVDANHHVTRFSITDGNANTDQIHNVIKTDVTYFQTGGTYRNGGLLAEFFVGDARSNFRRGDKRNSWSYNYGPATLQVLPNGLWTYEFPAGSTFDQGNAALYAGLRPATAATAAVAETPNNTGSIPARTIAQQPLLTQAPQITFSPQIKETEERTAKLDLSYALPDGIPFFQNVKAGFNLRDNSGKSWGAGGYIQKSAVGTLGQPGYQPAVIVPTANIRGSFVGCQDTPGSLGPGGAKCATGFVPNINRINILSGQTFMTQQQFQDIIAQSMTSPAVVQFFNGAKDRSPELIDGWNQIDVEKVFSLVGAPNVNYDCVKECMGSDGKMYDQPVSRFKERTQAAYFMTDFSLDHIPFTKTPLPFGMELEGNAGYRFVRTRVSGTGNMQFNSIVKTAAFNPLNPNAAGGTVTSTFIKSTTLDSSTTDKMPIYNLALWMIPEQLVARYNHARTVARPPVTSLLPAGTCTFDERKVGAVDQNGNEPDQSCSNPPLGNPGLLAQQNSNQNLAFEWYPNKDTMFSVGAFKQTGKIGPSTVVGKSDIKVFAGSDEVDPSTGKRLADYDFNYSTYENGPTIKRKGIEFATKTAFTFLPWYLRYTGFDANYTKLRSAQASVNIVDLITGDPLPPARESKYSYNMALWYDDGKFSARVAVQAVASFFNCIAACGANTVNNYPNAAGGRTTVTPYNPGSPNFRDATRYIDGKIGYRYNDHLEFFIEGRNLGKATTSNSQGAYSQFADGTPSLLDYAYAGRRIMVGLNLRN